MKSTIREHGWKAWAEYAGETAYTETIAEGYTPEGAEIERTAAIEHIRNYQAVPADRGDDIYLGLLAAWKSTLRPAELILYFDDEP